MNQNKENLRHSVQRPWLLLGPLCVLLAWLAAAVDLHAVTPPVVRSTIYSGAHADVIHYALRPWMNTNTPNLTVEAWIYANDLVGHQAIVARSFNTNLYFGLNGSRLRFYRSGGAFADSTGTIAPSRWTHVAATYDGATARFYIDGAAAGSAALTHRGNNSTNGLTIGGQYEQNLAGLYAFNGYVDELRLWSVARSAAQISANLNSELRSGPGLLATFGSGGRVNDLTGDLGLSTGVLIANRESGFGQLPANLCIPWTTNALRLDAASDPVLEYRGAETIVLRSTTSLLAPDYAGYLMVCSNASSFHLFVGLPAVQQGGTGVNSPVVQVMADINVSNGTNVALGDWECRIQQDGFQGGTIMRANPPLFPTPDWTSWAQSPTDWQAATTSPFEFSQAYEFRVHGRHLNYFTNVVGLLVRYFDYVSGIGNWAAPRASVPNVPATFARADWCGPADSDLDWIDVPGRVFDRTAAAGSPGRTVSIYSGSSELNGYRLATTTTDSIGRFNFRVLAPIGRPVTLTYQPPPAENLIAMNPTIGLVFDDTGHPVNTPFHANSPYSLTVWPRHDAYGYPDVYFAYRLRGPLSISGVTPTEVALPVLLRSAPPKITPTNVITVAGTNFHDGVRVYFQGAACDLDPPTLCDSRSFVPASGVEVASDGLTVTVPVPGNLAPVPGQFRVVIEDPNFSAVLGNHWNYGPGVLVTAPSYPVLYGFEFLNDDDGPSWEEFEACYGDNVFVDVPFTDEPVRGVRDPYYIGFYLPVYLAWMNIAHGSCSGFAATSRLMANGDIPADFYDRPDNGDSVHGVVYPAGYPAASGLSARRPARWTGWSLTEPFQPINVWGKITSMQGAQTSAEFLNSWLGQLRRPIAVGPRRGLSVGDPVAVLNRVRTSPGGQIVVLGGRDFDVLHSVAPSAVLDDYGLAADARTPQARAGFSLIKIYDSNHQHAERYIEVDRTQNTFRYEFSGGIVVEGAGLYTIPISVFRGSRHALGPVDIAVNVVNLLRVLHTGAASVSLRDSAGGVAGWSGSTLVNSYADATPIVPPGAIPGQPDRFDRTLFLLPVTNPPTAIQFVSAGSNVVLHYALGGGDFAFGFHAPNLTVSNSIYGILIGSNQALQAVGVRAGAAVKGFSASVASRDASRRSLVWQLDTGAGTTMPDIHLERDEFASLKIRNHSADALAFRVKLVGNGGPKSPGVFEFSTDLIAQPGHSTLVLKPQIEASRGLVLEVDANNDGVPESVEVLPARGALRASQESGLLALRWRPVTGTDVLLGQTNVEAGAWAPAKVTVEQDGGDHLVKVPIHASNQFYQVQPGSSNCLLLATQPVGFKPNPWAVAGFRFEAFKPGSDLQAGNSIVTRNGITGLEVIDTVRIEPLEECRVLHLDVSQDSGVVTFEAAGLLGTVVDRQELKGTGPGGQRVTLRGLPNRIQQVTVKSSGAICVINNLCGERASAP